MPCGDEENLSSSSSRRRGNRSRGHPMNVEMSPILSENFSVRPLCVLDVCTVHTPRFVLRERVTIFVVRFRAWEFESVVRSSNDLRTQAH